MGGSSGGSISTLDLTKITTAANERIQQAFARERKILFVCGASDRDLLLDRISKTDALKGIEFDVVVDTTELTAEKVADFAVVVSYVHASTDHAAINSAVQIATGQRKMCLFVRSNDQSPMPQYVLQYRIRSLSWQELVELLRT